VSHRYVVPVTRAHLHSQGQRHSLTAPPVIHNSRCPDCCCNFSNSLCRKQNSVFTEGLFCFVWLCFGHRVIQGDAVDVWGQLNVLLLLLLRFFWISVVFQNFYVCVVKLLATLLCIMCYLFSSKVTTDTPLHCFFFPCHKLLYWVCVLCMICAVFLIRDITHRMTTVPCSSSPTRHNVVLTMHCFHCRLPSDQRRSVNQEFPDCGVWRPVRHFFLLPEHFFCNLQWISKVWYAAVLPVAPL
jgi:hypothetical protein